MTYQAMCSSIRPVPVFFNGLPQYLKKELVRLEKRAVSIITSGKCNSAIEVGLTPISERYYVLCSRLFENIVSDPNHKLKALLPPDYDNSRYNLRRQRHFNMPKLCIYLSIYLSVIMRCKTCVSILLLLHGFPFKYALVYAFLVPKPLLGQTSYESLLRKLDV